RVRRRSEGGEDLGTALAFGHGADSLKSPQTLPQRLNAATTGDHHARMMSRDSMRDVVACGSKPLFSSTSTRSGRAALLVFFWSERNGGMLRAHTRLRKRIG
ncbi:MAG TPA: hypothetical protein VGE64_04010, partial [Xanthomonadaceae bacterium]